MTKTGVNLLLKAKAAILEEPKRLRMLNVIRKGEPGEKIEDFYGRASNAGSWGEPGAFVIPKCGAVGCIAGWVCRVAGSTEESIGTAEVLLGDTKTNGLFYVNLWPDPIREKYYKARTQKQRAKLVGIRIDQFIAEHANG